MFSFKADTKEALLLKQAVVHENLAENAFQFSFLQLKEKLHEHKVKVKVKSLSCVRLFATPWTVAYQAPPSMGFSSCPTLCDPMDCSLSGSSVHGIFQARLLEWIAISFSRGSS